MTFGKGLPDAQVFEEAFKEERAIITIDKDFYEYKKKENYGIISISGKLMHPIDLLMKVIIQLKKDQRVNLENSLQNMFIRITNQEFYLIYKKKNKYKEIRHKFSK